MTPKELADAIGSAESANDWEKFEAVCIDNSKAIIAALRGVEAAREALAVPQVWSDAEAVGMERAFTDATHKHGLYESLFAAAAWLLRHRAASLSQGEKVTP